MRPAEGPPRGQVRPEDAIRHLCLLLTAWAAAGCGGGAPEAPEASGQPEPSLDVIAGPVRLSAQTVGGERLWTVEAERAEGSLDPRGSHGGLEKVRAVLYERGEPALRLSADRGFADEALGRLDLAGRVAAESEDGRTRLTCDRITWARDARELVATGDVAGVADGVAIRAAREARARFARKDDGMNGAAAALTLVSLAVQGSQVTYRDASGNMSVTGLTRYVVTREEERGTLLFVGRGGPFEARWASQGLTVRAREMEAVLEEAGGGGTRRLELSRGAFSGGVEASLEGSGGNMNISGLATWVVERGPAEGAWAFSGSGEPFRVSWPSQGLVVTGRRLEGGARTREESGRKLMEWTSGRMEGGVTAELRGATRREGQPERPWLVTARAASVRLDRALSRMALEGGVTVSGDHPILGPSGGQIAAPRIVVEFDPEMRVPVRITAEGDSRAP